MNPDAGADELLTVAELAQFLKVSRSQVRILTLTNRIPHIRLQTMGRGLKSRFRYSKRDVIASLASCKGKA